MVSVTASATGMTTRKSGWLSLIRLSAAPNTGSMRLASPALLPGSTQRSVASAGMPCGP